MLATYLAFALFFLLISSILLIVGFWGIKGVKTFCHNQHIKRLRKNSNLPVDKP